jgi:hypothetical protein
MQILGVESRCASLSKDVMHTVLRHLFYVAFEFRQGSTNQSEVGQCNAFISPAISGQLSTLTEHAAVIGDMHSASPVDLLSPQGPAVTTVTSRWQYSGSSTSSYWLLKTLIE